MFRSLAVALRLTSSLESMKLQEFEEVTNLKELEENEEVTEQELDDPFISIYNVYIYTVNL
ncbi:hypothetical protein OEV75_09375 [Caldibacillus kokeshiiformis]|nr:hypothetical protein [Pallidibacillus thermolactis subsp. kokeshiiformis]